MLAKVSKPTRLKIVLFGCPVIHIIFVILFLKVGINVTSWTEWQFSPALALFQGILWIIIIAIWIPGTKRVKISLFLYVVFMSLIALGCLYYLDKALTEAFNGMW